MMQLLAGKHVFVSGISGGQEVFLGVATDEPEADLLTVEGKAISLTPQGFLAAKPFTTLVQFPIRDANCQIQQIPNPEAINECNKVLSTPVTQLSRTTFPLVHSWVESSIKQKALPTWATNGYYFSSIKGTPPSNPFLAFFEGFMATAEQFHRVLFQSPQVSSTTELNQLSELEGDLVTEIGKITNQIAVNFNQLIRNEPELTHHFETVEGGFSLPVVPSHALDGWLCLINRFEVAKNWTRRHGKVPIVREVNTLMKEGITRVNEVILDHCSALDILIAETCSQYGISLETQGEMSPFASYTTPYSGVVESAEVPTPVLAGAGA